MARDLEKQKAWKRSPHNLAYSLAYSKARIAKTNEYLNGYKSGLGCLYCRISNPVVLHFHHRDPATKSFNIALSKTKSMKRIVAEVEKCDVLCANCHLIEHERLRNVVTE